MLIAFVVAGGLFTPLADVLRELLDLAAFGGTVVAPGVDRAWLAVAALLARAFVARVPPPGAMAATGEPDYGMSTPWLSSSSLQ